MAKTIILGYADEGGVTNPSIIGAKLSPAKQIEIFNAAKREHKFPEGCKRIEFVTLEVFDTAILISEAGEGIAARKKVEAETTAKKVVEQKAVKEKANALAALVENVKKAAKARNDLLGKQHAAKIKLRNATLGSQMDGNTKAVEAANKELEELNTQVEAAIKVYETAEAEFAEAKNPKEKEKK